MSLVTLPCAGYHPGMSKILDRINVPADLAELGQAELTSLAAEVRELIIRTVSETGGHLGPNLGVVELTIALLRIFDPEKDRIVWDVGHQSYAYKILTGRRDQFGTLRQQGGLSGFLKREESRFDVFGAGHAGTAMSAALGMAVARDRRGSSENVVAVLGDGAAGCGISLEAMNNLHGTTKRLIVVLNDNEMSIAANVGSMSRHLGGMLANPRYNRWKVSMESMAHKLQMGWLRSFYYRIEEAIKSLFLRSAFFEELGLRYVGPIDGHNMNALIDAFAVARDYEKPIILHVATQKGRGYAPAEKEPEKWHGTSPFNVETGEVKKRPVKATYSSVFGTVMERIAEKNEKVIAITAAMASGTGLANFRERFPERFFDVGMSEEHAVVFAAGLATEGCVPVFAVYSTFFQRSIDCIIHDVCLQKLPVVFCLDRAGIVGDDGPTHHGVFDISLLRPVPGLIMMQPKDESELAHMLHTAVRCGKPVVIRYPRGAGPGVDVPVELEDIPIGKAEVIRPGSAGKAAIWALGDMIPVAVAAAERLKEKGIEVEVVNGRFIRPLDDALLSEHSRRFKVIATLENGLVRGGFGAEIEEFLGEKMFSGRVLKFGWPDAFIPQGSPEYLAKEFGLTSEVVFRKIIDAVNA